MISCPIAPALLVLALQPSAALADSAGTASEASEAEEPATVTVTGQRNPYGAPSSRSATRTMRDLKDVPQAVSVITGEQIADQGLRALPDVLRGVPGVAISAGEGHRDQIALRGNSTTADFFQDGLRDDVQYYRGLYNVERIEVLKGPNALMFGRGGGGGVINRVMKRPTARDFTRGEGALDAFGAGSAQTDINVALDSGFAVRLNAVAERFDSFRQRNQGKRFAVNPTASWEGESTRVDVGVEYARDRRVVDRGVPSDARGRPAPSIANPAEPIRGYERTFFGNERSNRNRFTGKIATAQVEHRFDGDTLLSVRALAGDYDKYYGNVYAATPAQSVTVSGVTDTRVGLEAYNNAIARQSRLLASDLSGKLSTGPLEHRWLIGADFAWQRSDTQRQQGFFAAGPYTQNNNRRVNVPLGTAIAAPAATFACERGLGCNDALATGTAVGLFVQDEIAIGRHVDLIAGIRHDNFKLDVNDRVNALRLSRSDSLWSPRIGLVVKPTATLSLYGSVARSFLPQSGDQFSSLDVTTAALEPERFTNREVGVKWRPRAGLDITLAAYRLDRSNTRASDPVSGLTVLTGAQRSKGVELQVQGAVTPRLSVSGGVALQDARLTRTTSAGPAGRKVALVPRLQASLWARQQLTDRLGVGLGAYHQSKAFASISNAVVLPAFTRLDGAGFFKLSATTELQVNVENLLNRRYVASANSDNNLLPANPRSVRVALRVGL
jgi:catecholate siderophore receptor